MQANFDARAAAAGTPAAPMERRQPEARKDRWMQELERAAMAEGAAARAAPRAAEARVPETPAVQEAAPSQRGASVTTTHGEGRAHGAASGRSAAHAGADMRVGPEWTAPRPAGTAASAAAVSGNRWAAVRAGTGSLQPTGSAAQQMAAAAPALLTGTPAAVLQLAPASAAMLDAEAVLELPAPTADAQAPNLPPDGEAYARSLFHLVHAEDGVHAWLRDASLSQAQARRVASAMAGELALAGSPLAALTVNGRRILSPGASGDQSGRRAADLPGEADVPPLPPVAFKGA